MKKIKKQYYIKVLGRTIELLGVQMYKQRDAAIAELIANCWDAGAKEVYVEIPTEAEYKKSNSVIKIIDTGTGMSQDAIQTDYLVLGRNRRKEHGDKAERGRLPMGRKGIGKLAGFGIASRMKILTWKDKKAVDFILDIDNLKANDDEATKKIIEAEIGPKPQECKADSGTIITLENLKHSSPIKISELHESLARRFSRVARGEMKIFINGKIVDDIKFVFLKRAPEREGAYQTVKLSNGKKILYYYGITETIIKPKIMQGFSIIVRGKVAQRPPFYFKVEGTASHQVGTKYFTGEILADYLDAGTDDESDVASTDRQELDWDNDKTKELLEFGDKLTRRILTERYELMGKKVQKWVLEDDAELKKRVEALDPSSLKSIMKVLPVLSDSGIEDKETIMLLADQLVRAYEYKHLRDVVDQIEKVAKEDPVRLAELLKQLSDWKVLESRTMLEIIKGRLNVSEKLQKMIAQGIPEVASKKSDDNLHDLLARLPWLMNPDWHLLSEEKSISKLLREMGEKDLVKKLSPQEARQRYDFLGLCGEGQTIIIEIKRSSHALELDEIQRLEQYKESISRARGNVRAVLIYSGAHNISAAGFKEWKNRKDFEIITWDEIYKRTRKHYEHYRAVLEADVNDSGFNKAIRELKEYRDIEEAGSVRRSKKVRRLGMNR